MIRHLLGLLALFFCASAWAQSPPSANTISGVTNGKPPAASVGAEGNYFLDYQTGLVFGPKTSNQWPTSPSTGLAPHISTTAALIATTTTAYPSGVWRDDYSPGLGAPPQWFQPETGNCAANGRISDGGSCQDVTGGNSFYAVFGSSADVREWGVVDSATNTYAGSNATALNAAVSAICNAGGKTSLQFPGGHFRYSSTVTVSCAIMVSGAGRYNTFLETTNATQVGFNVTTPLSVTFKDLQFVPATGVTPSGGAMVQFAVSGNANLESSFNRVVFNSYSTAIIFSQAAHWVIDDCTFYGNVPGSIALDISDTYTPDAGDETLVNSFLGGYAVNTQGVIYRSGGGLRIVNDKFVNLTTPISLILASGQTTSDLLIQHSSMEGFTGQAISLSRAGATGEFDNIHIQNSQFAEPQSWTNMLTYTSAIGSTNWTKNTVTSVLNTYASPDGNTAASSFTATAQFGNIVQSVTLAANTQYTFSVYAQLKSGTNAAPILVCYDGTYHTQAIAPVLNTWARYSVTWTTNGAPSGSSTCAFQDSGTSAWATYAIWGAQLEVGGYAKAYVPVTTTTLAYAAPIIAVAPDGNGSWISKLTATGNSFDANTANATNFAISSLNGWLYDGNISNCAGTCTQFVSTPNAQWGLYGVNPVDGSTGTFTANTTGSAGTTTHTTTAAGGG